ncbi:nitrilase-related carbon-nitrogen hydrolase [Temperatibacter marinus]|uniref:Nitrilase-related carbon-nitrogen hydrolase n=1 Tax=Temperatibacter marinus TaxID=1456591 RepID=A0AA52EJ95_9PROT|nr:nitrilase-related carbon-nitrogen hydrolase [Temperatibacter marinus]WND03529.1 nitrilase-related carbon-nitrogen hydrolase [Temperatibacter marinus]
MSEQNTVRVAAAQFAVGADIKANLASCLKAIDDAAKINPDLLVLPEFANHLSWYNDKQHCWDVSADMDDDFLSAIARKARDVGFYVVVNVTLRRDSETVTGTSLLFDGEGNLIADNDKQIYIGHENDFLRKALCEGPIVKTSLGRLGLYACMDGVINETPRSLGLRGGQILLNSLNSFASDEGSLHIPVRAAENKVFVVAANKVGPLVPPEMVGPISQATGIPEKFLDGAGESQIVAPDGTVLARASLTGEEVVYADIRPSDADNKTRPDGTDIFASRRPELYCFISEDPAQQPIPSYDGAADAKAAVISADSLDEVVSALKEVSGSTEIITLPGLLGVTSLEDLHAAKSESDKTIQAIQSACGSSLVATSIVASHGSGFQHQAVLIDRSGIILRQGQIHSAERFKWSALADDVESHQASFGKIALITSDDSLYPEHARRLALMGIEVACVPLIPLEAWELNTGLLERSAENRINYLVATAPTDLGVSFITSLQKDFTVMTEWQDRPFDGLLSQPIWTKAKGKTCTATIHPAAAENKVVSQGTDMMRGRPWHVSQAITAT